MFGLLNVHKPAGITSRDVVNRVQRLVKPHKAGHAGTLDPLATGVLVVCVGQATRLIEYVQRMPKRYIGTFLLGRQSETEDIEGTVVPLENAPVPSRAQIEAVIPSFVGRIQQMPPAYSALKVDGRRAYDIARKGGDVKLEARPIDVYSLSIVDYDYPTLTLDIRCGSGTYVRSLGRDIARAVGTEAVMSALVRSEIGPFAVDTALSYDAIDKASIAKSLRPAREAVADVPSITVDAAEIAELANGRRIANRHGHSAGEITAISETGRLVALLSPQSDGRLQPVRYFPAAAAN